MKFKKVFRSLITHWMQKRGYSSYFAYEIFDLRFKDFFINNKYSLREKIWAHKRGFFTEKIHNYNLNDNNYKQYLSDFDYYLLHPINGKYSKWIDDKLIIKYLLHPFNEYLPMYFFHIFNNSITKLPDCPTQLSTTLVDIINLLNTRGDLAIKQSSGALAEGFTKLSYKNNQYFINDRTCDLDRVQKFLNDLIKSGDYIITEYLFPSNQIGKIWNESPNTLRLMVIRLKNCEPELVRAYWRFGSKLTGVVDNPAVGGIISNVDVLTGKFCSGSRYDGDILVACNVHPDTNVPIEGSIENWAFLKQKVLEICRYIPDVCYLGFDVIITENGFRIIEINSHQGIKYLQHFEPLLVNTTCNDFFLTQIERKKKRFNRNYRRRYSNY